MRYQDHAPYTVLSTKTMPFDTIQTMVRFANFWDLVANSGNFKSTMSLFETCAQENHNGSVFSEFMELTEFLTAKHPQGHSIALLSLVQSVWEYLKQKPNINTELLREKLRFDYCERVKRDVPHFLRVEQDIQFTSKPVAAKYGKSSLVSRQNRHHTIN